MHVSPFLARAVAGTGLVAVVFALTAGCSRKEPPPPPTTPEVTEKPELTPEEKTARDRGRWIASLKSTNQKSRQEAVEQLSIWAETDPATVAALVELLKDRSTAGRGRTNALQINSIREAATRALLESGGKGEAAIREKGLAVLRDGLADPDAAVREHTVYTIGLLGPLARPLSGKLIELCTDKDGEVRGRAFDALRSVGITDPTSLVKLMTNEDREVANLSAQLAASLEEVPDAAVPPLVEALASEVEGVPTAAATALATAGPKAAPAAEGLVAAIKKVKEYQGKYDPDVEYFLGPEYAYWRALAAIGEPAVRPLAGLLTHENALVRGYAAQALGEIGKPAKAVADKLRVAFKDDFGFVAVEAACALVRAGEAKDEAIALMKRAILATNSVAMTAIDAIPRMGEDGKVLIPEALALLKLRGEKANAYAQYAGIGLVGKLPPEEATKYAADLGELASHKEELIRQRAGIVLEKLGPAAAPAAAALGSAIPQEENGGLRDQFIDALIAMGPAAKEALPTLLKLAAEESAPLAQRQRLISAIVAAAPDSKEVAAVLVKTADDPDQDVRASAATALAKLNPIPADALAKLVSLAKNDRGTYVRIAAYRSLAVLGPRAAPVKSDVEALAKGKYPEFVLLAKVALASIGGDAAKAAADVRAGLTDRHPQVRAAAIGSLYFIGPAAADLPAISRFLKDRDPTSREFAVKCLGKIGPAAKETVPQLIKMLDDAEVLVRLAAIDVLGNLGPAAMPAVEKLKQLRGTDMAANPQLSPAARKALEKLGVGGRK